MENLPEWWNGTEVIQRARLTVFYAHEALQASFECRQRAAALRDEARSLRAKCGVITDSPVRLRLKPPQLRRSKEIEMAGKFEIFKDKSGEYRFHLKAPNGEIIASSQGYKSKDSAEKGIHAVQTHAPGASVLDESG